MSGTGTGIGGGTNPGDAERRLAARTAGADEVLVTPGLDDGGIQGVSGPARPPESASLKLGPEPGEVTEKAIVRNGQVWTEYTVHISQLTEWDTAQYLGTHDKDEQARISAELKQAALEAKRLLQTPKYRPSPDETIQNTGGAEVEYRSVDSNGNPVFIGSDFVVWRKTIFSPTVKNDGVKVPNPGGGEDLFPVLSAALTGGRENAVRHVLGALIAANEPDRVLSMEEESRRVSELVDLVRDSAEESGKVISVIQRLNGLLTVEAKEFLNLEATFELGREQHEENATPLPVINGESIGRMERELRLKHVLSYMYGAQHGSEPFLTGALPSKLASHFSEPHMAPNPRYSQLASGVEEAKRSGHDAHFRHEYRQTHETVWYDANGEWDGATPAGRVVVNSNDSTVLIEDYENRTILRVLGTGIHLESHNTANQTHNQPVDQSERNLLDKHRQTEIRNVIMVALSGCASGFCEIDTGFVDNRGPIGWNGGVHPLHFGTAKVPDSYGWLPDPLAQLDLAASLGILLPPDPSSAKDKTEGETHDDLVVTRGIETIKGIHPIVRIAFARGADGRSRIIRPESRGASAGPTLEDLHANIFFEWGLERALSEYARGTCGIDLGVHHEDLEALWRFDDVRQSMRQVEKYGMHTNVMFPDPSEPGQVKLQNLQDLMVNVFVPLARFGLEEISREQGEITQAQIDRFIGTPENPGVIMKRVAHTVPEEFDGVRVRDTLASKVRMARMQSERLYDRLMSEHEEMLFRDTHDENDQVELETIRAVQEDLASWNRLAERLGVGPDGQRVEPKMGISPSDAFRMVRDLERLMNPEVRDRSGLTALQMKAEVELRHLDTEAGIPSYYSGPNAPGVDVASWLNGYLKRAAQQLNPAA